MITHSKMVGQTKNSESALRHKVRNLRAKVRLLLPMDLCCKYDKRRKNLLKMVHNKQLQEQTRFKRWNHKREDSQQVYIPQEGSKREKHLFYKLTHAEIEQIKEDKLYYVGEQFIDEFDAFLADRNKNRKDTIIPKIKTSKAFNANLDSIPECMHKTSYSECQQFQTIQKQNRIDQQIKNMMRVEQFKSKRKMITEEDLTRRVFIKMKRLEKNQRHQANYQKEIAERQKAIRERNKLDMLKTYNSVRFKQDSKQLGTIYEMSQKLRAICINRNSKSANLIKRYL